MLTWLLQENEPMDNNGAAHFSLPHLSLHSESHVGNLFGSCHNQSGLPVVLCLMCQTAWKDGDLPQETQVAGHLLCRLWLGMIRPPGCCHFVLISMLGGFAGQVIGPAGGFSLAAVLRKGFLLQKQWIFSSMFEWICGLPSSVEWFVQLKKKSEQGHMIFSFSVTSDS